MDVIRLGLVEFSVAMSKLWDALIAKSNVSHIALVLSLI